MEASDGIPPVPKDFEDYVRRHTEPQERRFTDSFASTVPYPTLAKITAQIDPKHVDEMVVLGRIQRGQYHTTLLETYELVWRLVSKAFRENYAQLVERESKKKVVQDNDGSSSDADDEGMGDGNSPDEPPLRSYLQLQAQAQAIDQYAALLQDDQVQRLFRASSCLHNARILEDLSARVRQYVRAHAKAAYPDLVRVFSGFRSIPSAFKEGMETGDLVIYDGMSYVEVASAVQRNVAEDMSRHVNKTIMPRLEKQWPQWFMPHLTPGTRQVSTAEAHREHNAKSERLRQALSIQVHSPAMALENVTYASFTLSMHPEHTMLYNMTVSERPPYADGQPVGNYVRVRELMLSDEMRQCLRSFDTYTLSMLGGEADGINTPMSLSDAFKTLSTLVAHATIFLDHHVVVTVRPAPTLFTGVFADSGGNFGNHYAF